MSFLRIQSGRYLLNSDKLFLKWILYVKGKLITLKKFFAQNKVLMKWFLTVKKTRWVTDSANIMRHVIHFNARRNLSRYKIYCQSPMESIRSREATANDFHAVLNIDKNVYGGMDYLRRIQNFWFFSRVKVGMNRQKGPWSVPFGTAKFFWS